MALAKALKYTALAIVALVLVSVVVSLVSAVLSLVWALVTTAVTLLVLGGLAYGGFKLFSWLSADGSSDRDPVGDGFGTATDETADDPVARLRERYANGEISEAELERRLELELDGPRSDGVGRELDRERS